MKESEVAQSCPTLRDPRDCSLPGSSVHGIFQQEYWSGVPLPSLKYPFEPVFVGGGKNTGMSCHFRLQEIFLTQGSNPGLPHCRQTLYHLSHQWSPNRLQYTVNITFLCIGKKDFLFLAELYNMWDRSYPTKDQVGLTCFARWMLNHWTTWEVPLTFFPSCFPSFRF